MKKILTVLLAMMIISTSSMAQIEWGFKIGPNFGSWSGEDAEPSNDESKSMKLGLHAGPFMVMHLAGLMYLQADLLYSNQGVVYKEGDTKYKLSTNHINLPIALRIQTPGGFYAIVGPQIGFTLGGKYKYEYEDNEDEGDLEDLRTVILSGVVGLGYRMPNGWGAYVRYARGFSSVYDIEDYDIKAYHSTLSLSLFYMLAANKKAKSKK